MNRRYDTGRYPGATGLAWWAHDPALSPADAEARLFPLARFMCDAYAAALLLEHAGWQHREAGTDRGALVARLYARAHLADPGPLRGIDSAPEELARFDELVAGAL